ncbi:diaminopimelate decarboxylase [soil metagenome]
MVWPDTTRRNEEGQLIIGDVLLTDLANEYGTPLYIFDEQTLRARAMEMLSAVREGHNCATAVFAAKALGLPAILALFHDLGMGIDVVSGGELFAALSADVPAAAITFHGNNKDLVEIEYALEAGVAYVVIDNFDEIRMLGEVTRNRLDRQKVLLRLNPGIDVHTHGKIATGIIDSKFGFPLWTGDALKAAELICAIPGLELSGYHVHLGSQLFDLHAPVLAARMLIEFAESVRKHLGVSPSVISPGGGMGIAYDETTQAVDIRDWVRSTVNAISVECQKVGMDMPQVVFEPGRALVGQAGVGLYRVGSRKEIPGVRIYVSVDGGMADNIRPTLYDATYIAEIANRLGSSCDMETVTIAGRYCESGDLLISDIALPRLEFGDLLAVPAVGAYCIPLASNYNMSPRPAVVMVGSGDCRLIRRRETFKDLLATTAAL